MVLARGRQQRATWLLGCPSPHWGVEENGKKKAKTLGSGEGQFNRTANEAKSNDNNTDKKNIQNKQRIAQNNSHRPVPCMLPSRNKLPHGQLPHSAPRMTAHGIEYPVLFGQFGSACLAVSPPGFLWKLTLSWPNPGQHFIIFTYYRFELSAQYSQSYLPL